MASDNLFCWIVYFLKAHWLSIGEALGCYRLKFSEKAYPMICLHKWTDARKAYFSTSLAWGSVCDSLLFPQKGLKFQVIGSSTYCWGTISWRKLILILPIYFPLLTRTIRLIALCPQPLHVHGKRTFHTKDIILTIIGTIV